MADTSAATLRLGFDAIRALRNSTGLGNYARGVLRGLHAVAPAAELHLYTPRAPRSEFRAFGQSVRGTVHLPPRLVRRAVVREWWRTFRLGRVIARGGVQLYHGLTQEIPRDLPRTGIPSIVTVADLLYQTNPDLFPAIDRRSYRWRYRWSAEHATAVVAISEWTRQQLHQEFGVPLDRIAVVHPARDPRYAMIASESERATVRARYGLPDRFIICVGTLEARKRQLLAIESMALLNPTTPPLVLIGRDGGAEPQLRSTIARLGLGKRVQILSHVTRDDLPSLTQSAAMALYLSSAEGFGMPIVEAMSAGVPVIAAAGPHLREAGGNSAHYLERDEPAALAEAMAELLRDGVDAAEVLAGRRHAERFDAAPLARQLLGVYDAVMSGSALPPTVSPDRLLQPDSSSQETNA